MGHRNEPARTRHREKLKQQLSLYSIPLAEPRDQKYSLENHFGWKVLQKCKIGEGTFPPQLLQCMFCDKPPNAEGGDNDKVTYLLYVRGKDEGLEPLEVRETQTISSVTLMPPVESTPLVRNLKPEKNPSNKSTNKDRSLSRERKKLISELYYVPIKTDSKDTHGERPASGDNMVGRKPSDGKKVPKKERGRSVPKGWQLRAGAECYDGYRDYSGLIDIGVTSGCDVNHEAEESASNINNFDCSNCFSRSPKTEELLKPPSERNRYLYMPKERYEKRSHKI